MHSLLISICLVPFLLFSNAAPVIVVPVPSLATHTPRFYLGPVKTDGSFQEEYVCHLHSILADDIEGSLRFELIPNRKEIDLLIQEKRPSFSFLASRFDYGLTFSLKNRLLCCQLIDTKEDRSKELFSAPLVGNRIQDRDLVHQFFDLIHKEIFGFEGIASTKILFAKKDSPEALSSSIYEIGIDGHGLKKISESISYQITPVFIPKSRKGPHYEFIYVSYQLGESKIFLSSTKEPKGSPLIPLRGNQLLPAMSPKGDWLAFISDVAGRADLFIQKIDANKKPLGKAVQLYGTKHSTQASPSFSPDGSTLAFVSDKEGSPKVFLFSISQTLERHTTQVPKILAPEFTESISPCWSPDGKKIAFSAKIGNVRQIVIYDFESQRAYPLTTGVEEKENPSFAPDGLHIVYNTTDPSYDLYVIDLVQKRPCRITSGGAIHHYPYWEPR